jgi:hypothetical protein
MQLQALRAGDPVILAPARRGAVRAAAEQPMQNRDEHRALQRKAVLAVTGQRLDRRPAAGLLP